jgi:hypothetical protein
MQVQVSFCTRKLMDQAINDFSLDLHNEQMRKFKFVQTGIIYEPKMRANE